MLASPDGAIYLSLPSSLWGIDVPSYSPSCIGELQLMKAKM